MPDPVPPLPGLPDTDPTLLIPKVVDQGVIVEIMLEGLLLSEASLRCSIIWAGAEYPCSGGPEIGGKKLDEGGFRLQANLKIKVRVEVFPDGVSIPQEKQTILYKRNASAVPKRYRIDSITNYYGAYLLLECNDPAAGA
jgi:hypothetical protein